MKKSALHRLEDWLFGHKYYANIILVKGTQATELTSFIHYTRRAAERHMLAIRDTSSFEYVETVSFRSRHDYLTDKTRLGNIY